MAYDYFDQGFQAGGSGFASLGQAIQQIGGQVAKNVQQKKQQDQQHAFLKSVGVLSEQEEPVSTTDLEKTLQQQAKKSGSNLEFMNEGSIDEETRRQQLLKYMQSVGIPVPQGKKKTVVDWSKLPQGSDINLTTGETSVKGGSGIMPLANQILAIQQANKQLEDAGMGGYQAVGGAKGAIVKPKTGGQSQDIKDQAKSIVQGIKEGNLPPVLTGMARTAGLTAAIEVEAQKQGFNLRKVQSDYMINAVGAKNLSKFGSSLDFAEKRFDKTRQYALKVANEINSDTAPLLRRAFISGEKELAGNTQAARVYAALYPVAVEYAKLVTGNGTSGNMTDTAREEGLKLVDYGLNNGQLDGLLGDDGVLTNDAQFSKQSIDEALNDAMKKVSGENSSSSNQANGVLNAAGLGQQSQQFTPEQIQAEIQRRRGLK